MFKRYRANLAYLLAVPLVVLLAHRYAQAACTQECREINDHCYVDGKGECVQHATDHMLTTCYKYDNNKVSCWTCGKLRGFSANGYCNDGDQNKECNMTSTMIRERKYKYCVNSCDATLKNTWLEAAVLDPWAVEFMTPYHQCEPKQGGS